MTEDVLEMLGTLGARGVIGLFYNSTWGGVLAFIIFAVVAILAIIGLISVLKAIFGGFGFRRKEDPGKKWLKTGRM